MKAETLISIIFIVLFVVIPFLKEIFKKNDNEADDEQNAYQESQSAQQIREYLEKMRGLSPNPSQGKQSHALYESKSKARGKKQEVKKSAPVLEKAPLAAMPEFNSNVAVENKMITTPIGTKIDPIHNVYADTRFSEAQKALIFYEIFKTPNFVEQKR